MEDITSDIRRSDMGSGPRKPPDSVAAKPVLLNDPLFAYGLSVRGQSHVSTGTPCQDFCCAALLSCGGVPYVAAIAADGISECCFSHFGAERAVEASCQFLQNWAAQLGDPPSEAQIHEALRMSMEFARDQVEERADLMAQPPFQFFSTLTVTLYDGCRLHIGHIGDDGVVARLHSPAALKLVTTRHKGASAHSVVPLQSEASSYEILTVPEQVDGYLLATDGVLDDIVSTADQGNLVYEPFVSCFLNRPVQTEADVLSAQESALRLFTSVPYRQQVTDDITMVCVGSRNALKSAGTVPFHKEEWDGMTDGSAPEAEQPRRRRPKASGDRTDWFLVLQELILMLENAGYWCLDHLKKFAPRQKNKNRYNRKNHHGGC